MGCSKRIVDLNQNEGSTIVCEFVMEDSNGNPIDTTGINFTFTGKEDADSSDAEAAWQKTVVGVGTGAIDCSVSSIGLNVGSYRYDIIADDNGYRETFENSSLIINQTVTD